METAHTHIVPFASTADVTKWFMETVRQPCSIILHQPGLRPQRRQITLQGSTWVLGFPSNYPAPTIQGVRA